MSLMKYILPLSVVAVIGFAVVNTLYNLGNSQGYAPEQPIPFSHVRHVTENKIPCRTWLNGMGCSGA